MRLMRTNASLRRFAGLGPVLLVAGLSAVAVAAPDNVVPPPAQPADAAKPIDPPAPAMPAIPDAPQPGPEAPAPLAPPPADAGTPPAGVPAFPPPAHVAAPSRVELIPARKLWVEEACEIPAVMQRRSVPVTTLVRVPIVETRRVPLEREIEVPVLATREVPVTAERRVPEYGPVEVPVLESRRVPVDLNIPNPFGCDDWCIHLWDRCEQVESGRQVVQGVTSWRTETIPTGTRTETYVSGYETRKVSEGERLEQVVVGEREEPRVTGWRTETVVVQPARTEARRVCRNLPQERVTVVAAPTTEGAVLAPGTTRVVTEAEFQAALAQAR